MSISRRDFILVTAAGAIGAGTPGCSKDEPPPGPGTPAGSQPDARAVVQLSVLVSGLIGMVSNNGGTDLLLVDGQATLNQAHEPRLLAPPNAIASGSVRASGSAPDGRAFWDLRNHRVTLMSGVTTGTTRVTGVRGPNEQVPANSNSQRDVSWVAQMSMIPGAGAGRINPGCLAPDPRPAKIASRVRFNGGEVAARFKPPFHQVIWQIGQGGPPSPFRQALGELKLSQMISTDRVIFRLEPFVPGPGKEIVLAPGTGANLEVEIQNQSTDSSCYGDDAKANNLHHFAAFYQLLAQPATATPIPVCQTNCPGCPLQSEPIYCPPADYAP